MAKKILLGLMVIIFLQPKTSFGQPAKYGLGLIIFDPSGLTAKAWLKNGGAFSGAVGWSGMEGHELQLQADYLFFDARIASDPNVQFSFYLGVGAKIIFKDNDNAWFRIPLGIDFFTRKTPLNIFLEIVPSFNFDQIKLCGAIGIRYIFSH